ncbi:peroxisomal nicotinamide adenine dinucleotide carrier-like isoform X2 [Salvia hispanica]|uniref:peroxisomal nicotinamide adenine dinucleotide carrier-like isoform X2 n=1 Tax=Salvia hispanica TaxID=49212 RepID=UPI0020092C65|nr:peroxisomal nicotinamide adenine dinucleotide carrier-like isoform X2 [Salvia hispanica]
MHHCNLVSSLFHSPISAPLQIFGAMSDPEALIDGLVGAGGGFIAQLVTYPLQTVNTRQQIERDRNVRRKFGALEQMYHIVEQEGWERLYGGFAPSLVGIVTSEGVHNYFYQKFRNKAETTALAGCVSALLTNPISLVVTRMQTHTKKNQLNHTDLLSPEDVIPSEDEPPPFGINLAIQEVYGERGVLGFWRGALPTLIMVTKPSIQFMLYEPLLKELKKRKRLSSDKHNRDATSLEIFLLETLANLGATVMTYPLLVIKSRLQAKQTVEVERHRYKGTVDAIDKMIRYEGWYGFYKGLSTKIAQSVLAAALPFLLKEKLVQGVQWVLLKAGILFFKFIWSL